MATGEDQLLDEVRQRSAREGAAEPEEIDLEALGIGRIQRIIMTGLSLTPERTRPTQLAPPVGREAVAAAEAEIGVTFPPLLVRLYTEVADGGLGPGIGLLPIAEVPEMWHSYAEELVEAEDLSPWPDGLVPICELDQTLLACVDCTSDAGPVVGFEFDDLDPDDPDGLAAALHPLAPSLDAWLRGWLAE